MVTSFGLAFFAVVVAVVALWDIERLKLHFHVKDQTSTKKWEKAANGPRYQVLTHKDVYPVGSGPSEAAFFAATSNFAQSLNELYLDGSWSFEDEGKLDKDGSNEASRRILIRHGQQKTGTITIHAINFGSDNSYIGGLATAKLEIINARFWPFYEVYGIAVTVAQMIVDVEKYDEAKYHAAVAAMDCMWMIGSKSFGNPDFEFSVTGKALMRSKL
jgi:hypothetical protein